jgi:hypothetical protein
MSDLYDRMARDGSRVRMLAWNALTREQKDQARSDAEVLIVQGTNNRHVVLIAEDLLPTGTEAVEDETPVVPPNTPVIPEELDVLTVAQLKELADEEEIDISGLKVKADILGRIWAIREERDEKE